MDDASNSLSPPASDPKTEQFLKLLGAHERSLFAYVYAIAPNWQDAEEIMQRVRIRIWQQFAQYDEARDFNAWARAIAYYLVLAYRKEKVIVPLAKSSNAFSYHSESTTAPHIVWEGEVNITADAAVAAATGKKPDVQIKVRKFLTETLQSKGPVAAEDIIEEGQRRGFSERQLRTAREKLGLELDKSGLDGGWTWELKGVRFQ